MKIDPVVACGKYVKLRRSYDFLADRTNGRAIGTVLRPSVDRLYGMYCG